MGSFFSSGRIVDCILVFMACELGLLLLLRQSLPLRLRPWLANVGAGAALLLALRAALTRAEWPWVAAWLMAALLCHLAEFALRWSEARTR